MLTKVNLYIVADAHHLTMIAKNELVHRNHLRVLRKVQYQPDKYEQPDKGNSSHQFDGMGMARSNPLDIKPKKKAAKIYLIDACRDIAEEFKLGNFKNLTLIANPEVMSVLKEGLSKKMKQKVFHEIYKEYSKLPLTELEEKLLNEHSVD